MGATKVYGKSQKADGKSLARKKDKPRTKKQWCVYRCQLSCKVGRDAIEGKIQPPVGYSSLEYAVFNLLHAVEELSRLK